VQNQVFLNFEAGSTCCEKNTALCVGGTRDTHLVHNIDWYILNTFVLMCYSDYIYHFSERPHAANVIFKAYLLIKLSSSVLCVKYQAIFKSSLYSE
jgi:hypothetical protein